MSSRLVVSFLVSTSRRRGGSIGASSHHSMMRVNCLAKNTTTNMTTALRGLSTKESPGGIRGWMEARKEKQEQEKYMEQMERLSNMTELTLANYREELNRGLDSWGAKLSFGQTKEIKLAKEVVETINCFIDVLGKEATADDLINMDRLERLKVATQSNKSVEEIQIMISQVQNMDLMQRTLKKRREEGKPTPPDSQSMQAAIKKDALAVMSKSQKEMMKTRQQGQARRMARRRR